MKFQVFAAALATVILSGCQSTSTMNKPSTAPHVVNNVVVTEPVAVDYKSELAIAKLTQIISHAKLENEKLAQLYYDRGVIYDSLGLRSLAQLDFRSALELKPDYADAYNFIGIHLTLLGQYSRAFDAFDSALEIQPDHTYVHLNRGIALHYYGRNALSLEDIELFQLRNTSDPYRAIWMFIVESEINPVDALTRLRFNAQFVDKNLWGYQIVRLLTGEIKEQEFINGMLSNVHSTKELADRLCEGYFYLAKLKLMTEEFEQAKNYLRLSLATNVYEFVEHKYARVELNKLYEQDRKALGAISAEES
jgi:lipoprotein NlpI